MVGVAERGGDVRGFAHAAPEADDHPLLLGVEDREEVLPEQILVRLGIRAVEGNRLVEFDEGDLDLAPLAIEPPLEVLFGKRPPGREVESMPFIVEMPDGSAGQAAA